MSTAPSTSPPSDAKTAPLEVSNTQPPPSHPDKKMPGAMPEWSSKSPSSSKPDAQSAHTRPHPQTGGILQRAFSKKNKQTATRFFSAYAHTWVGLTPIWLMGEAITPGTKVGTQFKKGKGKLVDVAGDIRELVATSSKDVVVIVDEKLRGSSAGSKQLAERTAEVIKAAGENAMVVVTSSLEKLSAQFADAKGEGSSRGKQAVFDLKAFADDPDLKHALRKHGRDGLILLDRGLKHPVVVTGVSRFARTRGIPHADALLRLASLGLGKILRAFPEDIQDAVGEAVEAKIEEIDAEELERMSLQEDQMEAAEIGKASEKAPVPKVEEGGGDPYEAMRKRHDCIIM